VPTVTIDNDATREATIIEVSGRDRPGLLTELARTLSEAGLSIRSAHIDSYGERAVDAFYVRDEDSGRRVTGAKRLLPLRAALTEVLSRPEPQAPAPKLARVAARAGR